MRTARRLERTSLTIKVEIEALNTLYYIRIQVEIEARDTLYSYADEEDRQLMVLKRFAVYGIPSIVVLFQGRKL